MSQKRRLTIWTGIALITLLLVACAGQPSSLGKFYPGRTLVVSVVAMKTVPELRYATIDPEKVIRNWRITPSKPDLELVMVRLKVQNHTAVSAIVDVDQKSVQLRDFFQKDILPIDVDVRPFQDFRGDAVVDVHVENGGCFDPERMYINPGTTVNWVNDGTVVHNVKLDINGGEPPPFAPGARFTHTFDSTGTWDYTCTAPGKPGHPARIVVEDVSEHVAFTPGPLYFIRGSFELLKGEGIDGWMVFEAPKGTKFKNFRWRAGDTITIPF